MKRFVCQIALVSVCFFNTEQDGTDKVEVAFHNIHPSMPNIIALCEMQSAFLVSGVNILTSYLPFEEERCIIGIEKALP